MSLNSEITKLKSNYIVWYFNNLFIIYEQKHEDLLNSNLFLCSFYGPIFRTVGFIKNANYFEWNFLNFRIKQILKHWSIYEQIVLTKAICFYWIKMTFSITVMCYITYVSILVTIRLLVIVYNKSCSKSELQMT